MGLALQQQQLSVAVRQNDSTACGGGCECAAASRQTASHGRLCFTCVLCCWAPLPGVTFMLGVSN